VVEEAALLVCERTGEQSPEHEHRMLGPGVLRIRLDAVEPALLFRALDLEPGDERRQLVADDHHDRPLGREEVEARVVLDVRLVEEHDRAAGVLEHALPPARELGGRNARRLHRRDDIRALARD
jgi:hypothetical protein